MTPQRITEIRTELETLDQQWVDNGDVNPEDILDLADELLVWVEAQRDAHIG